MMLDMAFSGIMSCVALTLYPNVSWIQLTFLSLQPHAASYSTQCAEKYLLQL